jgi:hypothetical protein
MIDHHKLHWHFIAFQIFLMHREPTTFPVEGLLFPKTT